jgi:hypothetical protein
VGVSWWAGWTEMPRVSPARRNTSDRNTRPWSMTTVSGMMTGLAAASSARWSMLASRLNGIRDADRRRASSQPGRIGSGTIILASSTAASTALAPTGRRMAAPRVRVPMSIAATSSGRPGTPSSMMAMTSSGVPSIRTSSPGRAAVIGVNAPSGRLAACRRVVAGPKVCFPADSTSRRR